MWFRCILQPEAFARQTKMADADLSDGHEMKRLLKKLLATEVLAGPFRGMRYLGYSSGSTLMPKILGTYERELHGLLAGLRPRLKKNIVIVGAAEGYYAVGFLYLEPQLEVIAFEMCAEARTGLEQLAAANSVSDRLVIRGACSPEGLIEVFASNSVDLLVVDVEGYEKVLLDPANVPQLKHIRILVELHDESGFKMEPLMRSRFEATHAIDWIAFNPREPGDIGPFFYRLLAKSIPAARHALLWERADDSPGWLMLTPR